MKARSIIFCLGLLTALSVSWLWPRIDRPPTRFEIAQSLLESGRADDALVLFEDPVWRGIAQYRAGRYTRAAGEFFPAESTLELYNMGTAFAQLEQWASAIAALEKVLRLDPEHADARHNLDIVLKAAELESDLAVRSHESPQLERSGGERPQRAAVDQGEPGDSQPGGADDNETASANAQFDDAGNSDEPGRLGDEENTVERGSAVAFGTDETIVESTNEQQMGGSAELEARESAMAAEILLRQIRDDPEKVLRARLYAAHRARQPSQR